MQQNQRRAGGGDCSLVGGGLPGLRPLQGGVGRGFRQGQSPQPPDLHPPGPDLSRRGGLWSVGGRWRVSEQPFSSQGPAHPGGRLGCAARSWMADRILCWRPMRGPSAASLESPRTVSPLGDRFDPACAAPAPSSGAVTRPGVDHELVLSPASLCLWFGETPEAGLHAVQAPEPSPQAGGQAVLRRGLPSR